MAIGFTRWEAPLRLVTGAYILQRGLAKYDLSDQDARSLHDLAKAADIPGMDDLEPGELADLVSVAETALGGLLLAPFVPRRIAGLALLVFGGVKLHVYWHAPGLRQEGSYLPTDEGLVYAKDVLLCAIGLSLCLATSRKKERQRTRE